MSSSSSSSISKVINLSYPREEKIEVPLCLCLTRSSMRTSFTQKNPMRRFFTCSTKKCKFWMWYDRESTIWEKQAFNHLLEKVRAAADNNGSGLGDAKGHSKEELQVLLAENDALKKKNEENEVLKEKNEALMNESIALKMELERFKERTLNCKIFIFILLIVVFVLVIIR